MASSNCTNNSFYYGAKKNLICNLTCNKGNNEPAITIKDEQDEILFYSGLVLRLKAHTDKYVLKLNFRSFRPEYFSAGSFLRSAVGQTLVASTLFCSCNFPKQLCF